MTNKFSCFLTQKGRWLTATLFLLFSLGIGNMWGAEIFSAVANSSSDLSVNSKSQVQLTASQAIITGGKMYYTVTGTSNRVILDDSQGPSGNKKKVFGISGNDQYYSIKLNNAINEGDTIYVEIYADKSLWFTASSVATKPSSAPATITSTGTSGAWTNVSYVVAKNSVLDGVDTLHVWRNSGNTYFTSIRIAQKVTTPSCTKPGTPGSLQEDSKTHNSATFSWSAAANSDGYKVYVEKKSDASKVLDWTTCATNSYTATGLDAETEYTFKVKAVGVTGYCELGDEATIDVTTEEAPAVTPVCPSGVSISGTTAYTAGETIELTAALSEGNGTISYQWYKGSVAAGNEVGTNSNVLTIASCTTSDEGNYYCVASKDDCSNATSSAYAITVAAVSYCTELVPATSGDAPAAGGAISLTTATGGSMKALTANISYSANGLLFGDNSSTKAEVTLTHLMQVGTVITATIYNASDNKARGLKLLNNSGTSKATWTKTMIGDHVETYTVVAGDGLAGSNVFQLLRSENAYLKDLKVSNCGAELHALTSAIDPVAADGKATITLSKSLIAAGGTATATYSDIDAAYDFDEWVVSGATIDNAKANPVTITMGSTDATITLKLKAAAVKHTVTYYNGAEDPANKLDDELIVEGNHPTGAGLAPRKLGYTFAGWSTSEGGAVVALNTISVAADMPLFAVFNAVNCSAQSGTIFSVILNKPQAENCTIRSGSGYETEADLIKYGTVSGGIALAKNSSTSNHIVITTDPKLRLLGGNGKVHIQFDCALQKGDKIRTTIENQNIAYTTSDSRSTTNYFEKGTAKELTITKDHVLENASEIYLWAGSSNDGKLISLEVIRPEKYAVTFNMHGHGTQVEPQNIISGGKVTEPATTDITGWDFGGWYKTYVAEPESYSDAWDFANDVVSEAVELHAKWTEHAASTDATLSALSVAGCTLNETFAPATTAYTVDIPFYASMPAVGDVTATKNDENAKTPVVSIAGNVVTIHCEAESGATLDYTITVSTASAPTASSSINIEQAVLDNGMTWGYAAALSAANIAIVDANELDSINESKDYRNEPFLGLKFKKATSQFTIVVPASTELNVKFGSISSAAGLKVSVNGSTPAAPSLTDNVYTLAASAGVKEVVFTLDVADKTVVLKQIMVGEAIKDVTLPWKVSFNVGGHADAVSPMAWTGTALTLPGVTNVESGYAFEKWNDGSADYLEGADYTPTSNITLNAVYSMTVEDRLAELEFNGTPVAGFSSDVTIYNMTVPYSVAIPQITKAVAIDEVGGATATIQATVWDDVYKYYVAQAYVIPAGGTSTDAKFYQVRFTMDPKLGANIFTAELTSPTAATYSGLYADAENSKIALANDGGKYKFAAASNYITIALKDGAFAEGDLLKMTYSADPNQGKLALYPSLSSIDSIVSDDAPAAFLTLPAGSDAYNVLHIRRTDKNKYNGWVSKVEVLRDMNPIIASLKVGDAEATINEGAKTIALELPQSADITAIVPNIVAYANGGATVTPSAAQNFTSGPINYTVTSLYGETTTYAVSITKAAASSDATLSALTVNGQAVALADGVYDYSFELPYGTTVAPTVVATAHHAGAVATVDPCTLSGATITVVPESGVGDQQIYTLTFTISPWKEIVIFDGSYMTALATSPTSETELRWDVVGFSGVDKFSYQTTYGEAYCSDNDKTYSVENEGKYEYYQLKSGGTTKNSRYFKISVPTGYVAKFYVVYGSHSQGTEAKMYVGTAYGSTPTDQYLLLSTSDRYQLTGGMSEIVGTGDYYLNVTSSADFAEIRVYTRPGHYRDQMLGNGVYGTVCVDHNVAFEDIYGATFYELVGQEPTYGKIAFDEIISGQLEAGKPYLFQANGDKLILFYGDETAATPDNSGALKGTYVDRTFYAGEADDIYFFRDHALWSAKETGVKILANRAWLDMSAITPATPNPAPGRRRVTMAINGKDTATDFENLDASDQPVKLMINGQIFILRGEKLYDATGRLVK